MLPTQEELPTFDSPNPSNHPHLASRLHMNPSTAPLSPQSRENKHSQTFHLKIAAFGLFLLLVVGSLFTWTIFLRSPPKESSKIALVRMNNQEGESVESSLSSLSPPADTTASGIAGGWSSVDLTDDDNQRRLVPITNFLRYCLNHYGQPSSSTPSPVKRTYRLGAAKTVSQQVVAGMKYEILILVRIGNGGDPTSDIDQEHQFIVWDRFGTQMTILSSSLHDLHTPLMLTGEELETAKSFSDDMISNLKKLRGARN